MGDDVRRLELYAAETERLADELGIRIRFLRLKELKDATIQDYRKVARARLDFSDRSGGRLLKGVSRQSWSHHRAALLTCITLAFAKQVMLFERALKETKIERAVHHAKQARLGLMVFERVVAATPPEKRSAPKKSKRQSLPNSFNWQEQALAAATRVMRGAIVCGMVGARPQEIERGVAVEFDFAEQTMRVTIFGAKVTDRSGQPWRRLIFALDSREGLLLKALIPDGATKVTVTRRARRILLDWAERIRPALGKDVSHYSLRHQFAANLKAAGYAREDIAKALGHSSARSQSHYGYRKQGQAGSVGLMSVEAAREITSLNRKPPENVNNDYEP